MAVRVYRGRAAEPAADRAVTAQLLDETARTSTPAVRVWRPHRQVAFGRRDTREAGYEAARSATRNQGFKPTERRVGGRAVAYTGRTLAIAHAVPIADIRTGMCDRYTEASQQLVDTLGELGADVIRGEVANAYCPGSHSISGVDSDGDPTGKIAGIAQRVQSGAALVSACLTVTDVDEPPLREVLETVYGALDVPFDPASVGSVSTAGGPDDPAVVSRAVEDALVDGRPTETVVVGE